MSVVLEAKETDEPKGSTGNAGRNVASPGCRGEGGRVFFLKEAEKLNVATPSLYLKNKARQTLPPKGK